MAYNMYVFLRDEECNVNMQVYTYVYIKFS